MIFYFILFIAIGALVGYLSKNKLIALIAIIAIAIMWGLAYKAIWGFVSMGEMFLGYFVFITVKEHKEDVKSLEE